MRVVWVLLGCVAAGVAMTPVSRSQAAAEMRVATREPARRPREASRFAPLPCEFEVNRGQTAAQVDYLARCRGYTALLSRGGVATLRTSHGALRMAFEGARATVRAEGLDLLPGRSNYFIGNDSSRWVTDVAHCARVAYADVLPAVDVVFAPHGRDLEYSLILGPAADLRDAQLRFEGADSLALDRDGSVALTVGADRFVMSAPRAWQETAGLRRAVDVRFVLGEDGGVGFAVGARDPNATLVIDPVLSLSASTYLGGGANDLAMKVAADASGIYVAGASYSTDFPTTVGAFQSSKADSSASNKDVFVAKFNSTGTSLLYSTYLGSSGNDDFYDMKVDSNGSVLVGGLVGASDFPIVNAYSTVSGYGFLTKINSTGSGLTTSTFISTQVISLAFDSSGNVYALTQLRQVMKFNPSVSQVAYTTQAPPSSFFPNHIAVDSSGAVWAAGYVQTPSASYTTSGAFQAQYAGGGYDGLMYKIDTSGTRGYTTYIGGSSAEEIYDIAIDASGHICLCGWTNSSNFPMHNAVQGTIGGNGDAVALEFDSTGTSLQWSTYLGGQNEEYGLALCMDVAGNMCIAGWTGSPNFPVTAAYQNTLSGPSSIPQDAFLARFSSTGALDYATYLGASDADFGSGVAITEDDRVVIVGGTKSSNFPTASAYQSSLNGTEVDGFIAVFDTTSHPFGSLAGATLPDATDGASYSQALPVNGGTTPLTFTLRSGSVPSGTTLASNGTLSGTTNGTGPNTFAALIVDADGACVVRTYTVVTNPKPAVSTPALPPSTETRSYSQTLQGGGGTGALTWSIATGQIPAGTAFTSGGVLSGVLTTPGTYSFTAQVQDVNGATASRAYSVVVNAVPTIAAATLPPCTTTLSFSRTLSASGGTPPLVWSTVSGTLPVDKPLDSATGRLSGYLRVADAYTFTARVTDAVGTTADRAFSMLVNPFPQIDSAGSPIGAVGRPYGMTLLGHGGTPPLAWSWSGVLPAGLAEDSQTGRISGKPSSAGASLVPILYGDSCEASVTRGLLFEIAGALDLETKKPLAMTFDHDLMRGRQLRFLELIEGTVLGVVAKSKDKHDSAPTVRLLDLSGVAVDFAGAAVVARNVLKVKGFAVPASGRYFLEVTPPAAFNETISVSVAVSVVPPASFTGTAHLDSAQPSADLRFDVLAGATVTAVVKAAKGQTVVPKIVGLTQDGADLLQSAVVRTSGSTVTLKLKTPLGEGAAHLLLSASGTVAGDVSWTVKIHEPKTYAYSLPDVAAGE